MPKIKEAPAAAWIGRQLPFRKTEAIVGTTTVPVGNDDTCSASARGRRGTSLMGKVGGPKSAEGYVCMYMEVR